MNSLLNSLSAVSVILILTGCGYVLSMLGWIRPDAKTFLSKYLMRFAVPVMCVYSLRTQLTLDLLKSSWVLLLIPALSTAFSFLLSMAIGKSMRLGPKQASVFAVMCSVSNAIFIGYSMCLELFGSECTPYAMIFYLCNTAYAQLVGVAMIKRSGGQSGTSFRDSVISFFRTPSILGVLAGVFLILTGLQPPALFMSCAKYINNTVTPLALLMAGHIIWEIGLRNVRLNKLLILTMVFRFLISPGITLLLCMLFNVSGLAKDVLIVLSAMPVLTQTVVASAEYGADEQLAAQGIAVTTLACFIVIPVIMLLLQA